MPSSFRGVVSPRMNRGVALAAMPTARRWRANSARHSRKRRLFDVEPAALFAHGLDDSMDVGMGLIGMQGEHVAMLESESLATEVLGCREYLVWWHTGGHRKYHLVDQSRSRLVRLGRQIGVPAMLT